MAVPLMVAVVSAAAAALCGAVVAAGLLWRRDSRIRSAGYDDGWADARAHIEVLHLLLEKEREKAWAWKSARKSSGFALEN